MIEAGTVGAIFQIQDEASATLRRLAGEFERLDGLISSTKKELSSLSATQFSGMIKRLSGVGQELTGIGEKSAAASKAIGENFDGAGLAIYKAIETATSSVSASFGKIDTVADTSIAAIGKLKAELASLGAAAKIETPAIAAAQHMQSFTYKGLGVGAGPDGSVGRHGERGSHGHITPHGQSVGPYHFGGDGFMAAAGGIFAIEEELKHSFDMAHWVAQMRAAGADAKTIADATGAAWQNASLNWNTTAAEGVKNIIEAKKATGDWGEAIRLLPALSTASFALHSVTAAGMKEGFNSDAQILNFGRTLDELGITQKGATPEAREAIIRDYSAEMIRTMIGTRGLVDANQFYAMANNSGGTAMNWDERFATVVAPIIGSIMKAGKLGNSDYMALRSYQQGVIPSKTVDQMLDLQLPGADGKMRPIKLLSDADWYQDKAGVHLHPNNPFSEGLQTNPWEWSAKILKSLKAQGVDISNQDTMNKLVNVIAPNKSTGLFMRELFEPLARALIQKDINSRDAVPKDAAGILQRDDPLLKMDALSKKWQDLMTALGGPVTDPAIAALVNLTKGLNDISQFLTKYPAASNISSYALTAAASIAVLAGAIKLLGLAGPLAWLFKGPGGGAPTAPAAPVARDMLGDITKTVEGAVDGAVKGGAVEGMLSKTLRGGVVGGLVYALGDWAINTLVPLTPEQQKNLEDHSVAGWLRYLAEQAAPLMSAVGGTVPNASTTPITHQERATLPYLNNQDLQGIGAEPVVYPGLPGSREAQRARDALYNAGYSSAALSAEMARSPLVGASCPRPNSAPPTRRKSTSP